MTNKDGKPAMSFTERLKQQALQQKNYGDDGATDQGARMNARDCPNCGAGRAQSDGLTHCAYCGFVFIEKPLTEGIYIDKRDNSQQ